MMNRRVSTRSEKICRYNMTSQICHNELLGSTESDMQMVDIQISLKEGKYINLPTEHGMVVTHSLHGETVVVNSSLQLDSVRANDSYIRVSRKIQD